MSECNACPAGTRKLLPCPEPNCVACRKGTFSSHPNKRTQCLPCSTSCGIKGQYIVKECTSTQDSVCECQAGYFLRSRRDKRCERHRACPPGMGVSVPGTATRDNQCMNCTDTTFSSVSSATERCQPHTTCQLIKHNGNRTSDNVCSDITSSSGATFPTWAIVTLSLVGILILLVVAAVLVWRRFRTTGYAQKFIKRKTQKNDLNMTDNSESNHTNLLSQANIRESNKTLNSFSSLEDEGNSETGYESHPPPSFKESIAMAEVDESNHIPSTALLTSQPLVAQLPDGERDGP